MSSVPTPPVSPWYIGMNGATSFTRHEAQRFARSLVQSDVYRTTLFERIRDKDLPPAVEQMLWHYAFGKPVEQVQLTVVPGQEDLSTLSVDQLLERAKQLSARLEEAQELENALPGEFRVC